MPGLETFAGMPILTSQDIYVTIGGCALITHLIFNRLEPFGSFPLIVLLLLVPSLLSTLFVHLHRYSILWALCCSISTYLSTLLTSIAVYRLGPWHPLANYPGPITLKLSRLWALAMALSGKRHEYIQSLHEYYQSDYVRIGPNELSIRDTFAINPIMGTAGLARGPVYDGRSGFTAHRSLLTWRDPAVHARRRKPWSRGTNTAALREYEPAMAKRVELLGETILKRRDHESIAEGNSNGVVDLAECFKEFAFDFMNDMAFGGGSEMLRNGDQQGTFAALHKSIVVAMIMESLPWFSYHIKKIPAIARKFHETKQRAIHMAKQRILQGAIVKDLFHYLNNDDGVDPISPTLEATSMEGFLVVLAGSDTTSSVLCNVTYLLMKHPETYKRLQEEVDKFYPPGEDSLSCQHHSEMVFLEGVINETLRLYPVQPSGSQRATTTEGITIGSHYIPPQTSVRVHTYSIQRDARNFSPDPEAFFPDRWIISENPDSCCQLKRSTPGYTTSPFVHNPNGFIPFSFGPANCVGKKMALKEMKMVLCHLMQKLVFRFPSEFELKGIEKWKGWRVGERNSWEDDMQDLFVLQVGTLPVIAKERKA